MRNYCLKDNLQEGNKPYLVLLYCMPHPHIDQGLEVRGHRGSLGTAEANQEPIRAQTLAPQLAYSLYDIMASCIWERSSDCCCHSNNVCVCVCVLGGRDMAMRFWRHKVTTQHSVTQTNNKKKNSPQPTKRVSKKHKNIREDLPFSTSFSHFLFLV